MVDGVDGESAQERVPEPEWPEHLPPRCPPDDAMPLDGIVYRFVTGAPVTPQDMKSHAQDEKAEGAEPCVRAGLSVFRDLAHVQFLLGTPRWLEHRIASAALSPEHGKIKQTGKARAKKHHTMWLRRSVIGTAHTLFEVLP